MSRHAMLPNGRGRKKAVPFVQLWTEMIRSDNFRTLPPHAVKLLLAFADQYRGWNNGSLSVSWQLANKYWDFANKRVYYKTLDLLVERGFLELGRPAVKRGKPAAARYAITWQPVDEPDREHPHDLMPSEKATNRWKEWLPPSKESPPFCR